MVFEHYLNLMAQQTEFKALDDTMKSFANGQFVKQTNMLGGNGAFTQDNLNTLKKIETNAYLD